LSPARWLHFRLLKAAPISIPVDTQFVGELWLAPALPGAQHAGQRLPRLVQVGRQGVKAKAAAKRAAAPSFSECAPSNVASMSMMIRSG
jgi:hypothetical protein